MNLVSPKQALKDAELAYEEYLSENGIVRSAGSPQRGHEKNAMKSVGESVRRQIKQGYISRDQTDDENMRAAFRMVPQWMLVLVAKSILEWMIGWYIRYYFNSLEPGTGAAPDGPDHSEPHSPVQ